MLQIFLCVFAWSIAKERQWSDRLRTRKLVIKPRVDLWSTYTQCQLLRKFKWHQHFKSEKCNSFPMLFLVVNYSPPFCIAPLSVNKDHRDGWGARWGFVRKAILKNYLLCKMDIKIWASQLARWCESLKLFTIHCELIMGLKNGPERKIGHAYLSGCWIKNWCTAQRRVKRLEKCQL